MIIQSLWDCQVEAIIDVKLCDTDAYSYKYEPMAELLSRWKNIKKYKHDNHCHDQWNSFLTFVLSVEGMLGREDLVVLSQLS